MSKSSVENPLLVITGFNESSGSPCGWGTGGWLAPEEREGLDWFTLSRLLGWGATVSRPTESVESLAGRSWIIVACDLEHLSESYIPFLAERLETEAMVVVARAASAGTDWARLAGAVCHEGSFTGQSLRWTGRGPQCHWHCRKPLDASPLALSAGVTTCATLDGAPIVAARQVGLGVVATLGFHPSVARDADGAATSLLRHLLICAVDRPVCWLDWSGTLALRMDDPGGAQNIYSRDWCYRKLGEAEWAVVGHDLARRRARLSLGYVAGWVDDGDAARGTLEVDAQMPQRVPGRIYPSPSVRYLDLAGHSPGTVNDYQAEYRGIQMLRSAGLADVELHGYTHMHPDTVAWSHAADRHENWPAASWFRELGKAARATIASRPADQHPLRLGINAFQRLFHTRPTTLICPGDQWTDETLEVALQLGMHLVSSYYLAIRDSDRFCWAQHACAPYLDKPDAAWFDSGLPVVGYFHDYEPATEGVQWMTRWLDEWQAAGASRFIDLRELASGLGRRLHIEQNDDAHRIIVTHQDDAPTLVRPLSLAIHLPGGLPDRIAVSVNDRKRMIPVESRGDGFGMLQIAAEGVESASEVRPLPSSPRQSL